MVVALPMFLLTFWIPRSKRWLLLHGLRDEALESMRFIYRGDRVQEEFQNLVEQLELAQNSSSSSGTHQQDENPPTTTPDDSNITTTAPSPSLWNPKYRPALTASMGLIAFQQFSGQPSVLSYTTVLFQAAGWSGNASVVTSILMMFTSMTTVALVDRVGRKGLLFTCCGVMITSLVVLSACFWNEQQEQQSDSQTSGPSSSFTSTEQIVILIAMFVYIGGYQIGFGPITWCIVSEVFPLEIRGQAIALGVEWNYLLNFLVQFIFPIIQDTLGWSPSFALFGGLLIGCVFFIHSRVPETKGLTLEEIQIQLSRSRQEDQQTESQPERAPLLPVSPLLSLTEVESL
jgi:MFS family permease